MEGIIVKGVGGLYFVKDGSNIVKCKPRGIFRKNKLKPLPGDHVVYSLESEMGTIEQVRIRENELVRPAAANVTQALIVFALKNPDLHLNLLFTFLLVMEEKGIKPVLLFNKRDIAEPAVTEAIRAIFEKTAYDFRFICAEKPDDIEPLKAYLKDNLTILCGPSGAGKSTILNALLGEAKMDIGEVSEKIGRGKHTTRHTELVEIAGGLLADTPGFSNIEFILKDHKLLKNYFPEFSDFEDRCRFNGCMHVNEPDCAVKAAVGEQISEVRYEFYLETFNKLKEGEKHQWN